MKFNLLDKIESIDGHPVDRIVAVKHVTLAEEYLADHFPTFPVLPGVLMLEAMTQAAAWVLHQRTGFARSMAVLKEARNVKYGQFVAPGDRLRVDVTLLKPVETDGVLTGATFKAVGSVADGRQALAARLELAYFNLADRAHAGTKEIDAKLTAHNRDRWALISAALSEASSTASPAARSLPAAVAV